MNTNDSFVNQSESGSNTVTQAELNARLQETIEALRAAYRVFETANNAMSHLNKADNWATFDVWGGSGLFSHLIKYDHIDKAQSDFDLLDSQLYDLQKELRDVKIYESVKSPQYDITTKAVDFFFDNIFTDLNIRSRIRQDKAQMSELIIKINWIITKLECSKMEIEKQLSDSARQTL